MTRSGRNSGLARLAPELSGNDENTARTISTIVELSAVKLRTYEQSCRVGHPRLVSNLLGHNSHFRCSRLTYISSRDALGNIAENFVRRAVGKASVFEGIDVHPVGCTEKNDLISDRDPGNSGYVHQS